jgi:hypothetical protein
MSVVEGFPDGDLPERAAFAGENTETPAFETLPEQEESEEVEADGGEQQFATEARGGKGKRAGRMAGRAVVVAMAAGALYYHQEVGLVTELGVSQIPRVSAEIGDNGESAYPAADEAFRQMEAQHGVGNGLAKTGEFGWYAGAWPNSVRLDSFYVRSLLPDDNQYQEKFLRGVDALKYYKSDGDGKFLPAYAPMLSDFYFRRYGIWDDDNAWIGQLEMQAYKLTGDKTYLKNAKQVYDLENQQWQKNDGDGIDWIAQGNPNLKPDTKIRVAVANAPVASLAVDLYQETGDERYLQRAEQIIAWLRGNLYDPKTGLYDDHISEQGRVNHIKWTYTQGAVVKALLKLHEVKPEQYPLEEIKTLADNSLDYFSHPSTSYYYSQFDSKMFKSFLALADKLDNPEFTARVQTALKSAIVLEPKHPKKLLDAAGNAELLAIVNLPKSDWPNLI